MINTIPTILVALVSLFNTGIAAGHTATGQSPTAYDYSCNKAQTSCYIRATYGKDSILATVSPNGYVVTLCSATCRGSDEINLNNVAFIESARGIGCNVYEDASFDCPRNTGTRDADHIANNDE